MKILAPVALALLASTAAAGSLGDLDGAALHARLTPEQRAMVDEKMQVFTFDEEVERGPEVRILAVSLGTLRHDPGVVKGLLTDVSGYAGWVPLNPSYKAVRSSGSSGFVADIGSAHARAVRYSLAYDVASSGDTVSWKVTREGAPFAPGSYVAFEVVPHPSIPGASLVAHRQLVILPSKGRMTKYLTKENDAGDMKYWQDANKHARRVHWAMAAALEQPPGEERRHAYVTHYQREFGSESLPLWSQAR